MMEFKNGKPLTYISTGKVSNAAVKEELTVPVIKSNPEVEFENIGKWKFIPWYDGNDFPQKADILINKTPVLKRALSDITKITLGQGVFPCEVMDTLPSGEEVLKMIKDPIITNQLQSYMIRRYLSSTDYDKNSFGAAYVQFVPNIAGDKIVALNPVSALKCRLEMFDNKGKINNVLVCGKWDTAIESDIKAYTLLDEIDPMAHLLRMKESGELKNMTPFLQIKNSFSSNDFYPVPNWYSAAEWVKITNKVPIIIMAGYDNVLNIFFTIKIPYSYWEHKYPTSEFDNDEVRRAMIEADVESMETKFTSVENAKKALITFFGKEEGDTTDKWEFEIHQPKFNQENFVTSTAADTQIAIATGISPDLLGLMYGNSKGGSMQRELLLLQYALSWESRQQLADPIEMMLKINNPALTNLELRFRNTFLTTLDSGAGSATTLS